MIKRWAEDLKIIMLGNLDWGPEPQSDLGLFSFVDSTDNGKTKNYFFYEPSRSRSSIVKSNFSVLFDNHDI